MRQAYQLGLSPSPEGGETGVCIDCAGADPLMSPVVRGWIESSLKPPVE